MATNNIKKKKAEEVKSLVVHQVNQVSVDRTPKDIGDLRSAHRTAEAIQSPNFSRLFDLLSAVWMDGYLTGVWGKREATATNKKIVFVKNKKKVDELDELMETKEWDTMLEYILQAKLWSRSGMQFIPGEKFLWEKIPRKHIHLKNEAILLNQNDQEGVPYKTDPFVWVIGDKDDLGLMLKCSFYALIKRGNFSDWAQYSEIFGQPIRVMKYDAFDDKTRIQLKQVLDDSGSGLALMIPKQAEFEIMDGKTSNANGELQEKLKNACNNEMGIIILGNTETTANDNGGSNAKAEEQGEQQEEITVKDIKYLLSHLNDEKFLKILASYGYPVEGGRFIIQSEFDPYKVKAKMEVITMARSAGTPVSDDYVYEVTGIPKPDDYEALKAEKELEEESYSGEQDKKKIPAKKRQPQKPDLVDRFRNMLADFFAPPRY